MIGTELPPMTIEATPTFVISSAIATRDFQDVHHDRDRALERGSKDIFVNILTDTGLVQRFVTDWVGPHARVHAISIRLGVPCYAYDTLTFTGTVTEIEGDVLTVAVTGRGQLGDHVVGTVRVSTNAMSAGAKSPSTHSRRKERFDSPIGPSEPSRHEEGR